MGVMKEGDCKKQQSQMRYCKKKTSHKCKRSKKTRRQNPTGTAFVALSALDLVGPLNVAKCGGLHTM
jgi:hypothetical protein